MADEYTPTTDVVRAEYWEHGAYRYGKARGDEFQAEFDRWLAAYEAEVRERIAQDILAEEPMIRGFIDYGHHKDECIGQINGLRRAARIARGETA